MDIADVKRKIDKMEIADVKMDVRLYKYNSLKYDFNGEIEFAVKLLKIEDLKKINAEELKRFITNSSYYTDQFKLGIMRPFVIKSKETIMEKTINETRWASSVLADRLAFYIALSTKLGAPNCKLKALNYGLFVPDLII